MGERRQHSHPTASSSSKFIPTMNQKLASSVLLKLMKRRRHHQKAFLKTTKGRCLKPSWMSSHKEPSNSPTQGSSFSWVWGCFSPAACLTLPTSSCVRIMNNDILSMGWKCQWEAALPPCGGGSSCTHLLGTWGKQRGQLWVTQSWRVEGSKCGQLKGEWSKF